MLAVTVYEKSLDYVNQNIVSKRASVGGKCPQPSAVMDCAITVLQDRLPGTKRSDIHGHDIFFSGFMHLAITVDPRIKGNCQSIFEQT